MSNLKINSSLLCKKLTYTVSYKTGENGRNLTKKPGKSKKMDKITNEWQNIGKHAKIGETGQN